MEQLMIEQQKAEQALETINFGGVVWVKQPGILGRNNETYKAGLPGGGDEFVYVSQYNNGTWNWQRKFYFFEYSDEPSLFADRAGGVVGTRDKAMLAALAADKSTYMAELVDALAAAGFIAADSNYQRGFRDGQAALKTVIAGLEEVHHGLGGKHSVANLHP